MGTLAKLFDEGGRAILAPDSVEATLSWDRREGLAQAWSQDGKQLIAELVNAVPVWIGSTGMRLEGMESANLDGTQFRVMAWQFQF